MENDKKYSHSLARPKTLQAKGSRVETPPPFQLAASGGNAQANQKGKQKDVKISICADKEADFMSAQYRQGYVGHAWIKIDQPGMPQDSYGFWPANLGNGGGFDPSKPWKTVAGEVRNPDDSHTSVQEFHEMTDAAGLQEGLNYAAANKATDYNLITYNCTTFASKFFKKSTGKSAPSSGILGLGMNPNFLANNIERKNKKKQKNQQSSQNP